MKKLEALILDSGHRILARELGGRYRAPIESDSSLAEFTSHFSNQGVPLSWPIGVSPPQYAFIIEGKVAAPTGWAWVPLKDAAERLDSETYWQIYTRLVLGGYAPPSRHVDVFSFGNSPSMAARLAHLVIKGRKRATSGHLESARKEGLTIPSPGLVSIVTDGFGIPLCCIQTERFELKKFKDITSEVAEGEGEGDLSLESWRAGHWEYFTSEARSLGIEFTEASEVYTEWFRVLKVFGTSSE